MGGKNFFNERNIQLNFLVLCWQVSQYVAQIPLFYMRNPFQP